jgi:hypothetical protein
MPFLNKEQYRIVARVAQSVQWLTTDYVTRVQSLAGQRIFLVASMSVLAVGPNCPIQWVPWLLRPGVNCSLGMGLTTHLCLVPRARPWHEGRQLYVTLLCFTIQ